MHPQAYRQLNLPIGSLREFCLRWNVAELALFGSALRADFSPDSDVDVLVTFVEGSLPSLFEFARMGDELAALFGRRVDLLTRKSVESSPNYIRRKEILSTAQVIYAA
jgi:hypothetical protein